MEFEAEYWRRNRETFLWKEGLPHAVTISSVLRQEGSRYEGVIEELVGHSIAYRWKPLYVRITWFVKPIPGSHAQCDVLEKRVVSEAEYSAFQEQGNAALPQIWRIICSCGYSAQSRWRDHGVADVHSAFAAPGSEHTLTIEESPARDWAEPEITQL